MIQGRRFVLLWHAETPIFPLVSLQCSSIFRQHAECRIPLYCIQRKSTAKINGRESLEIASQTGFIPSNSPGTILSMHRLVRANSIQCWVSNLCRYFWKVLHTFSATIPICCRTVWWPPRFRDCYICIFSSRPMSVSRSGRDSRMPVADFPNRFAFAGCVLCARQKRHRIDRWRRPNCRIRWEWWVWHRCRRRCDRRERCVECNRHRSHWWCLARRRVAYRFSDYSLWLWRFRWRCFAGNKFAGIWDRLLTIPVPGDSST